MLDFKASLLRENKWLDSLTPEHKQAYLNANYWEIEKYKPRYRLVTFIEPRREELLKRLAGNSAASSNCANLEDYNETAGDAKLVADGLHQLLMLEQATPEYYRDNYGGWLQYHMFPDKLEDICVIAELAEPVYDNAYGFDDSINAHILEEPLESFYPLIKTKEEDGTR